MAWTVYMDPMESPGDLSSASALNSQKFTPAKDVVLTIARVGLIFFDPPTDLSITPQIYSDDGGSPGVSIATSTTTKTDLDMVNGAEVYGYGQFGFAFNNVTLKKNVDYHLVLLGSGTLSTTRYIGFRKQWPETQYFGQTAPATTDIGIERRELFIVDGKL